MIRQFYLWVIREPEAAAQWLKGENNRKNAQRLFYSGEKKNIKKLMINGELVIEWKKRKA